MTKAWEDMLILALRDAQWRETHTAVDAPRLPQLFLKFDGPTETALGDLAFQEGERFFLFEVKSSETAINTEWNAKVGDEVARKEAFKSLSSLTELAAESDADEVYEAVWTSLQCHHFVYWSEHVFDANDSQGNIFVEPYILACIRKGAAHLPTSPMIVIEPLLAAGELDDTGTMHRAEAVSFSALRQSQCFVTPIGGSEVDVENTRQFGVPLARFKAYLNYLIELADRGGSINAILWSTTQRYVKWIHSIGDLTHELGTGNLAIASEVEAPTALTPRVLARVAARTPSSFSEDMARIDQLISAPFPDVKSGSAPKPKV